MTYTQLEIPFPKTEATQLEIKFPTEKIEVKEQPEIKQMQQKKAA